MSQASDAARTGGVNVTGSSGTAPAARTAPRWLPAAGGLAGGIVAAGAAGTSTQTIFLGAVWAGTAAGILIILVTTYLAVRPAGAAMPAPVLRLLWFQVLRQTVAWSLGAYAFWFLIIEPELGRAGIYVPMFN